MNNSSSATDISESSISRRPFTRTWRAVACAAALLSTATLANASDQMYFPAVDNVTNVLVQYINQENVRIDISAWYLTEHSISIALANRFLAGVPIRLIGDRGSIFEIDPYTKKEFYWLANYGVPIRLRYNPNWYPEIDHWKTAIFVGQGVVEFGSANYTPFQLAPSSSTNFDDETALFTDDPTLVGAFETKFDVIWNDTTTEPESILSGPPYFKNWYDACASEPTCDFLTQYPNPAPMNISTARLEPDNPMPADLIWGQGPDFNNRLVTEINNESNEIDFVIYRLTVDNVTSALLSKHAAGVPVKLIIEPNEYLNRKWPEFWLSHANEDKLWAAGIPIMQRTHEGITHMKMLVTSNYATNASSNYAAHWERDQDYFVSAVTKPTVYSAMKNRFQIMWNDTTNFAPFVPQPPDAAIQASPASGATGVPTAATLTWNTAAFATSYDIYLGTSSSSLSKVGNVPAQLTDNPPTTYSFTTPTLAGGTTYYWQVVSRTFATDVQPSIVASSAVWSFTTGGSSGGGGGGTGGGALPSPWVDQDVGSVGLSGTASYSSGVFTVSGAGSDIWGAADSFNYASQPLSGDGQIVARVTSEQNTNTYAKAGVMFRETTAAGATDVILDARPDGSIEFMSRPSTGGSTNFIAGSAHAFPAWLKLVRSGSTFTASMSADGTTWTAVGSTTVSMATSALVGLAVTSHNTAALNSSTFDNVSMTAGSTGGGGTGGGGALPSPWASNDVGSTGLAGSASYSSGVFTVNGAGSDIWGTSDSFQYVNEALSGDGQIVARVASEQNTNTYAKAGVMLRGSLSASDADVILDVRPDGSVEFMSRESSGASTTFIASTTQAFPAWLKLARSGSTVTGSVSADGSTWTTVGSVSVTMNASALIGLAVTSHNTSALNTATFDNVTITAGTTGTGTLPSPWVSNDVGSTGLAGSGSYASGVFTVKGAGSDIWGTSDSFQYVNQPLSGDGQIIARVTSEQNTNTYAKAGVMIRGSLSASDADVILDVRPDGSVEFMSRPSSGAATNFIAGSTQPFPAWLKLVRSGSTITGSISADGSTWTTVGSTTVTMNTAALIGLAVTSHSTTVLNTATFDNVTR